MLTASKSSCQIQNFTTLLSLKINLQQQHIEILKTAQVKDEPVESGVKEFIEISTRTIGGEEVNSVSARDLYLDLGLDKTHWSRWSKENIEENPFFTQGVDFVQLATMATPDIPRPPKDYAVTIEFAKHIAMMAKTQRAHDYRNYFIECEKKAHEKTAQIEPPTRHTKPLLILSTSQLH